ncbi:hypothetical protein LHV18_07300 [Providencia rettgeri]|uniref:hypothetical protein n=1 Tax=Providencia rettgeri TaxID=587 RepID=UPI001CFD71BE|nr:hypothetical protein [Providencia rettgeri]EIU7556195.1 hypothetical protein [Providencia rettgeri]MCB4840439.1 hypothetical protein [Providencia rettgeri]
MSIESLITLLLPVVVAVTWFITKQSIKHTFQKNLEEYKSVLGKEKAESDAKYTQEIEQLKKDLANEKFIFEKKYDVYMVFMNSLDEYNNTGFEIIHQLLFNEMIAYFEALKRSGGVENDATNEATINFNRLCIEKLSELKKANAKYYSQTNNVKLTSSKNVANLSNELNEAFASLDIYFNKSINFIQENAYDMYLQKISSVNGHIPPPTVDVKKIIDSIIKACREELKIPD